VVEINETVMDHYLDLGEGGLSGQELHDAFEQCLREGHLVPVCFVSARSGAGVRELLDLSPNACSRIRARPIRRCS
jgi:elongation factor G